MHFFAITIQVAQKLRYHGREDGLREASTKEHCQSQRPYTCSWLLRIWFRVQITILFWHLSTTALCCGQKEHLCLILSDIPCKSLTYSFIKTLNGRILLFNFVVCLTCSTCGCTVCKLFSVLKIQAISISFHTCEKEKKHISNTFKIQTMKQQTEVFNDSIQYCSEKKLK